MKMIRALALVGAAALTLAGCATTGFLGTRGAPSWVSSPPRATAHYTFFVASGSDAGGNVSAATQSATHELVRKVVRYLGGPETAQTSARVQSDRKSLEERIARELRAPRGTSFSVMRRWVRRSGGRVTVHLLGRYRTADLQRERELLKAEEQGRKAAIAVSEQQGGRLLAKGRAYAAAVRFMEAARAAAGSTAAPAGFERAVKRAEEAVSAIHLTVLTDNLQGYLDQPLPKPFRLEVSATTKGTKSALADVPFRVSYPVLGNDGKQTSAEMSVASGPSGGLTVKLPPPQVFGPQSVTVALDFAPELAPLLHLAEGQRHLVAALKQRIAAKRVVLHYTTTSRAASIPTGVLVMSLDRAGGFMSNDETANGIIDTLAQAGYHIVTIPPNRSIVGVDDGDLVKILKNNYGDKIRRAIVGQARISQFDHSGSNYIVKVSGSIEVADLVSGKVIFRAKEVKLARASDATSAIGAALKDLGSSMGKEILNRLH